MAKISYSTTIRVRSLLSYGLQLVILSLIIWYFSQNVHLLESLRNIRWQHVFGIVALDVTSIFIGSLLNYSMIRRLNTRVTLLDCFYLQYANNLFNKILPTIGGGAAFRAIFLKKKYAFSYTQFASTITGLYVISFSTTAFLGLACLIYIYWRWGIFNLWIFLAFLGILSGALLVIVFSPTIPESKNRFLQTLQRVVASWNAIKQDPKAVVAYAFFSIVLLLLSTAMTWISYQSIGIQPEPVRMLYLSTLGIIMAFLNFTPDGVGVKEAIYVFSKDLVQIPEGTLVLGSMVLRGVSFITTLVFGGGSYFLLLQELKRMDQPPPAVRVETDRE